MIIDTEQIDTCGRHQITSPSAMSRLAELEERNRLVLAKLAALEERTRAAIQQRRELEQAART